jgi:hypothetical protein
VAEALIEAADQVDQHVAVIDGRPDVAQRVSKALDPGAKRSDGHLTLDEVVELLFGVDRALETVVEEELVDGVPQRRGGVGGLHDGVEDVGGDGGVEPRDDALIDLRPGVVDLHDLGVEGAVNMVEKAELAEGGHEVGLH